MAEEHIELAELIDGVVEAEWLLFDLVENEGGRASCQDDYNTFRVMRESQFSGWNEKMLSSYFEDLIHAIQEGRNLLAEKYAYMMESTEPDAFVQIKDELPWMSDEKKSLIEEIIRISIAWQNELSASHPKIAARGRAPSAADDSPENASFETYLRGELSTYSEKTLKAYRARAEELRAQGQNLNKLVLESTMRRYGFDSLDAAEAAIR